MFVDSIVDSARDLGVVIDSRLTMSPAGYYTAPSVASGGSITAGGIPKHYVLLYGISDSLFKRLQSIQNAAARFLAGAS